MPDRRHHAGLNGTYIPDEQLGTHRGRWMVLGVVLVVCLIAGYLAMPGEGPWRGPLRRSTCDHSVSVRVASVAEYSSATQAGAEAFNRRHERVAGTCAEITVSSLSTDEVSALVAKPYDSRFGALVAGPNATAQIVEQRDPSSVSRTVHMIVARTPVVVALPRPLAEAVGWPNKTLTWSGLAHLILDPKARAAAGLSGQADFPVWMSDPDREPASLAGVLGIAAGSAGKNLGQIRATELTTQTMQGALLTLDREIARQSSDQNQLLAALRAADRQGDLSKTVSAVLLDEQAVWSYNRGKPAMQLAAFYPADGSPLVDISYTPLKAPGLSEVEHAAASQFGLFLVSEAGQKAFSQRGFRAVRTSVSEVLTRQLGVSPDGEGSTVEPPDAQLQAAMSTVWIRLRHPGRFLVVIDVSGSMQEQVPGTKRTKLQFAQEAAVAGMQLVPPQAEIGLWEFATRLDGTKDYRELIPIGEVNAALSQGSRLSSLLSATRSLATQGDTGLYDTALASFRETKAGYRSGQPNVVVLLTDGLNDDANSIDLATLVKRIKAEQDPKRPVRFLTIAYGAGADQKHLAEIAQASGGLAYSAPDPEDIGAVFLKTLSVA